MAWAETRQRLKQALCHSIVFIFSSYFDLCPYWATSPMTKQRNFQLHFFWFLIRRKRHTVLEFLIVFNLDHLYFDVENVKFSIQIVVTCVLYNLFTPVFILFCTLCIFVNRSENCIKFKIFIAWVTLCKQVELNEYWMSIYIYRESPSEQHY